MSFRRCMSWLLLPLLMGCTLRGTDDLQAGAGGSSTSSSSGAGAAGGDGGATGAGGNPCGDGMAVCSGDCVDVLQSENHCGVCGEACGTGLCEQGSCRRVTDNFAGEAIVTGTGDRLFISESHRCGRRLVTFVDTGRTLDVATVPTPGLVLIDGISARPDGKLYFTAFSDNGSQQPLSLYLYDEATTGPTMLWTEPNPIARDLSQPPLTPVSYQDNAVVWASQVSLWSARTEMDGQLQPPNEIQPSTTGVRRIRHDTQEEPFWNDGTGLYVRQSGQPRLISGGTIVDFAIEGTAVVWAQDGEIRIERDTNNLGQTEVIATADVGRIALTIQNIYWSEPSPSGVLKRISRDGSGTPETLFDAPAAAIGALATTQNYIYFTTNEVDGEGQLGCGGRVYRRRLSAPAPP